MTVRMSEAEFRDGSFWLGRHHGRNDGVAARPKLRVIDADLVVSEEDYWAGYAEGWYDGNMASVVRSVVFNIEPGGEMFRAVFETGAAAAAFIAAIASVDGKGPPDKQLRPGPGQEGY